MKKIIVAALLAAFTLSGCFYQVTTAGDISRANVICAAHGGINHITVAFSGDETVECGDGLYSRTLSPQQ